MSRTTIYIVAGLVLMLLIGAGAVLFISTTQKPPEVTAPVEVVAESIRSKEIKEYFGFSDFAKPAFGGTIFASYLKLGEYSSSEEYIMYAWVYAQEYYLKDSVLTQGTGVSGPVVIHMNKEGTNIESIEMPSNGRSYSDDVKQLFPSHVVRNEIFSSDSDFHKDTIKKLAAEVSEEATFYFDNKKPDTSVTTNIVVDNIQGGATVGSPLRITGKAKGWYFEGSFPVRVLDANGKELAVVPAQAQGEWMTSEFVPFEVILNFTSPTKDGTIVFEKDNPSGLPENNEVYRIPVRFNTVKVEKVSINVYYPNAFKAAEVGDVCSTASILPVSRVIDKPIAPLSEAIKILLQGNITKDESASGFTTEFPDDNFYLKGATIKNGVAILEFSESDGFTSGGACRVGILRSQIEKTAKQFPEVKSVQILPETLFQP